MKIAKNNVSKSSALIVYVIIFYSIWTIWEVIIKPFINNTIPNEYISQFIKSGIIKNLVWTLPAILLVNHFKDDVYIGLKDMFTAKVQWLKYISIFIIFTVYLLAGTFLTNGKISISETFKPSSLITVLFVGITEEMVFRGWLLNCMVSEKKKWLPIIINSLMFLLIHFPVWIYEGHFIENFQNLGFLSIIILSIIFGWTFIKSKNILIPIMLHMYWDLLIFLFY
ncbi:MAG: CPBP family intramembrane metalloprotease [Oscillospiraceae bacterium]|nr:CPBP family intramembrane metalloprotease [Oscillospiraceae bacterium]